MEGVHTSQRGQRLVEAGSASLARKVSYEKRVGPKYKSFSTDWMRVVSVE